MPTTDPSMGRRAGQGLGQTERRGLPLLDGKVVDLKGPYRAMQFKAALRDTSRTAHPSDPVNL
jgi:hypothetical protein